MIKVCKTQELLPNEWVQMTDGFNICFHTNHSVEHLKKFYCNTIKGYSYHALDFDDATGKLRGYNSFLPTEYLYRDVLIQGGISGGTYVIPEYRKDVAIFMNLMTSLFNYCKKEGMVIKVGVPNKNSFKYTIKVNKAKLVGFLNYYILPLRPFKFLKNPFLSRLNIVPLFLVWLWVLLNHLIAIVCSSRKRKCKFELNTTPEFLRIRFGNKDNYKRISSSSYSCHYRIYTEGNVDVAYLMDFRERDTRTFKALSFAVRNIMKQEKNVAMVLFVGTMNMFQTLMIKLPHKFDPKPLPLTINVLNKDKQIMDDAVDLASWDFGLINFDAR